MDPAVVLGRVHVVPHVPWLRVVAQPGVVVGSPRCGERAQCSGVDTRQEQLRADQPRGFGGVLAQQPLLGQHGEDVGDGLVERAGLPVVGQPGGVLRHAVRQLVGDDRHGSREPPQHDAVTVDQDHLRALPERVVVALPVVHGGNHGARTRVEGVASVDTAEQLVGDADPVVGLVGCGVAARWVASARTSRPGRTVPPCASWTARVSARPVARRTLAPAARRPRVAVSTGSDACADWATSGSSSAASRSSR